MSNIDKRTAEIIFSARNALTGGEPDKPLAEWAEDVNQVFIDDGWYHSPLVSHQMKRIESGELMTGHEWYDKFEKELPKEVAINHDSLQNVSFHAGNNHGLRVSREAAKKAAGIE